MVFEGNNDFKMKLGAAVELIVKELKKFVKEIDPEKFVNELDFQSIQDDNLIEVFTNLLKSNLITPEAVRVPLEACLKSYLKETIKTFQNHINKE